MTIIIIGASFSGITAALAARKKYPTAKIILIDKKHEIGYLPSGLTLYLTGQLPSLEAATFITPSELHDQNITLLLETEVLNIKSLQQLITSRHDTKEVSLSYDKLIIATGANQMRHALSPSDKLLQTKSLAASQRALGQLKDSQDIAIIGGSQVGLEMAHALALHGKTLTIFEAMDSLLLKYFDKEMLAPFLFDLQAHGINIRLNEVVTSCLDDMDKLKVTTTSGSYQFDTAVLGLSLFPRLSFLDEGIACHADQTIQVDDFLQTTAPNIFAIGDCVQLPHSLDSQKSHVPLASNAIRTAELVVENLESPRIPFRGSLRTIGTFLFDYYLASTGITATEAIFYDDEIATWTTVVPTQLGSNPTTATCKIIYHPETLVVLGAQIISKAPILEKINTLALAIQVGLTLPELRQKDYFFHPAFTPLLDITNAIGFYSKDVSVHDNR